ncbi:MAG: hypothetical protein M5U34_26215 [Chloroflexi bacterium]|nr:hypothetical protein [Chloroflexota bacterium]
MVAVSGSGVRMRSGVAVTGLRAGAGGGVCGGGGWRRRGSRR